MFFFLFTGPSIQKQRSFREMSLDTVSTPLRTSFPDTVSSHASSIMNDSLNRFSLQPTPPVPVKKKKKKKDKHRDALPFTQITSDTGKSLEKDKKRKFSATDSSAFDGAFVKSGQNRLTSSSQATHNSKGRVITKIILPATEKKGTPTPSEASHPAQMQHSDNDPFAEPYGKFDMKNGSRSFAIFLWRHVKFAIFQ